MEQKTLLTKKIWMLFAILFLSVASTQAATITYSLTTHVDGRNITGTANLNSGADLLNNMPQALWRAYCTYSFYSDEAKTQEITTAPAENTTVYVDYVFDPPFIVTPEDGDEVWHNIRTYNSGGDNNYMLYLKQKVYPAYEGVWGHKYTTQSPTPSYGKNGIDPNADMAYLGHCQWAFYGDSYSLNIKINDTQGQKLAGTYLLWPTTLNTTSNLRLGGKAEVGWQLYVNTTQKQDKNYKWYSYPTMVMGVPNSNWYMDLENVSYAVRVRQLTSDFIFDSHNQLVPKNSNPSSSIKNDQWWFGLFATPVGSGKDLNYNVTYKILQYDGTWYPNIVEAQTDSYGKGKKLSIPAAYTQKEGCTYEAFYKDQDFTEKYADDYVMPNKENIIVYIKEIKEDQYVSEPWKTLVIPFTIENVDTYFGEGAVQVNEYTEVEGHLRSAGGEEFFTCHLKFKDTKTIVAYKPYLFKAVEVKKSLLDDMYARTGEPTDCTPTTFDDKTYAPGINVSMIGVLEPNGSVIDNGDGLKFYFASKEDASATEGYRYGFVRSKASFTIPKNRCYFYVTDDRNPPSGMPLSLTIDANGLTGIGQMIVEGSTAPAKIYNINGQLMRTGSASELPKGIYIANGKKFIVK